MAGTLLCLLSLLPAVLSQDFVCYASTDCHGVVIPTLPEKGECCSNGRGLSFTMSGSTECKNCFSIEEFCSEGSKFYMAFFNNLEVVPILSQADIMVQVTNMDSIPLTVTVSSTEEPSVVNLDPENSVIIDFPIEIRLKECEKMDKGVFIKSTDGGKLSVTAFSSEFTSSDTFQLLPCVYLPSRYEFYAVSVTMDDTVVFDRDGEQILTTPQGDSVLAVVASEDNTQVILTPTQNVFVLEEPIESGTEKNITLNEGETLFVSSVNDLTGSHVIADKPVSFFSGHECGNMPSDLSFCDLMVEQLPPTATWGKEFFTLSYMNRPQDRFRVVSSRDNNSISWNCTNIDTKTITTDERDLPTAGSAVEFEIREIQFCCFISRSPVLMVQFSVGGSANNGSRRLADPSMAVVPPVGQYRNSYILNYFKGTTIVQNFVNIILLNNRDEITTDGTMMDGNGIDNVWSDILCEDKDGDMFTCAYGVQIEVTDTMNNGGTVSLSHLDPDAQLMAITYSEDYRTGQASFSGMTQKPIALDEVTLSSSEYSAIEGDVEVSITLMRSGDLYDDIIIPFRAHAITGATNAATPGEDFIEVETDILLPASIDSVNVSIPLGPDDIFPGEHKVFEVYLGAALGIFVSPDAYANVTIIDPDPSLPVMNVSFAQSFYNVTEGDGCVEVTLIKSEGGVGPVTVTLIPIPGIAQGGLDFELNQTNITFRAMETVRVIQIPIVNDDVQERVEDFTVMIVAVDGIYPVNVIRSTAVIHISDNDFVLLALETETYEVAESTSTLFVNVSLIKGSYDRNVTVSLSTLSDTAISGRDFDLDFDSRSFNITPSTINVEVPIDIIDDFIAEDKEYFLIELRGNEEFSSLSNLNISIIDDDYVTVSMTVSSNVTSEAEGNISVLVSVDAGDVRSNIILGLSTIPISARSGVDFGVHTNTELAIRGSGTEEIDIKIIDNDVYDGEDRKFAIVLNLLETDFERVRFLSDDIIVYIIDDEIQPDDTPGVRCTTREDQVITTTTPHDCCVTNSGRSYESSEFTIECIVIGFESEVYNVVPRSEVRLTLGVLQGSLAQNITLTIISTPITAAADDYNIVNSFVKLQENRNGVLELIIPPSDKGFDTITSFRLDVMEESHIIPRNVFFRGADVNIVDIPGP